MDDERLHDILVTWLLTFGTNVLDINDYIQYDKFSTYLDRSWMKSNGYLATIKGHYYLTDKAVKFIGDKK